MTKFPAWVVELVKSSTFLLQQYTLSDSLWTWSRSSNLSSIILLLSSNHKTDNGSKIAHFQSNFLFFDPFQWKITHYKMHHFLWMDPGNSNNNLHHISFAENTIKYDLHSHHDKCKTKVRATKMIWSSH